QEVERRLEQLAKSQGKSLEAYLTGIIESLVPSERDEYPTRIKKVILLATRKAEPDQRLLCLLEQQLQAQRYTTFVDHHLTVGVEWAKEIERQVRSADAVIPLLSAASIHSEMLCYEVRTAYESAQHRHGKPRLLPIRVQYTGPLSEELATILN